MLSVFIPLHPGYLLLPIVRVGTVPISEPILFQEHFLVGAGGVVVAMYVFRKAYHLEKYITEKHFDKMGRIVVLLALLYLYFNINEYLVPAFKMKKPEEAHLTQLFTGEYALLFWFAIIDRNDHSYHYAGI